MPEVNIEMVGHIAHGKSTLVHALTGKWTQAHSEELKHGLTIRLGYADFEIRKCKKCTQPECYTIKKECPVHKTETEVIRKISFVDSPGHETLMATMLSGAAVVDGAILVIAANEPCPQPQTREHLLALEITGIKNIIIVQNKIDLVDEEKAKENYEQIKEFVKGTIAENAPIIPVSAQYGTNIDYLLWAIQKYIPTPKRDLKKDPIFLTVRSFDVNKPGTDVFELRGGVLGGVLKQGKLKVGQEIIMLPGRKVEEQHQTKWLPIKTKIVSATMSNIQVKEIIPGGSVGVSTELDPLIAKSDALVGQVVGLEGKMPPVFERMKVKIHLLKRIVGSKEELKQEPLKVNEPLLLNVWTARTVGIVTKITESYTELLLKLPVCIYPGERIVISRRIGKKWRLVGYGEIIDEKNNS